eukprot:4275195-Pleurochrysis_carterae.AAC.1
MPARVRHAPHTRARMHQARASLDTEEAPRAPLREPLLPAERRGTRRARVLALVPQESVALADGVGVRAHRRRRLRKHALGKQGSARTMNAAPMGNVRVGPGGRRVRGRVGSKKRGRFGGCDGEFEDARIGACVRAC